jgi:hypothetical protein
MASSVTKDSVGRYMYAHTGCFVLGSNSPRSLSPFAKAMASVYASVQFLQCSKAHIGHATIITICELVLRFNISFTKVGLFKCRMIRMLQSLWHVIHLMDIASDECATMLCAAIAIR